MALGFVGYYFATHKIFIRPQKQDVIFAFIFLALAFLSSFWSPDQAFSIERSLKITAIIIPGLFLIALSKNTILQTPRGIWIALGIFIFTGLLLLSEKTFGHPLLEAALGRDVVSHKLNRSFVVFSFFSLPVLFLLKNMTIEKNKKIILSLLTILVAAVSLYFAESQTAQLCFLTALFFLYLFPVQLKKLSKAVAGFILILILVFPFLVGPLKNTIPQEVLLTGVLREASIIHRLEVWQHTSTQALQSPLYGRGIEALRFLKAEQYMEFQKAWSVLHAHNAALQIWVEFGFIGITLALFFLFVLFKRILAVTDDNQRRFYFAVMMVCLSCALTGYGLWQGWLLGLFFLIASVTIMAGKITAKN